jgi:hypothetical protein
MSEWWTYQLSDFLMFSPEIYWRLVERYNRDVWPLQLLALVSGCVLLWLAAVPRPSAQRITAVVLAAAWLWTGWAFAWQRYATINWAAQYLAIAFGVEAVLLVIAAVFVDNAEQRQPRNPAVRHVALGAAAFGVLLYPLAGLPFGRPTAQAEVFGLMPDPTALTTLGLLFAGGLRYRGWLAIIPALGFVAGMLTLWTMAA